MRQVTLSTLWRLAGAAALWLVVAGASVATAAEGRTIGEEWLRNAAQPRPDVIIDLPLGGRESVARCGTPEGTPEQRAAVEQAQALWRQLFPEPSARMREIPVAFHVLHDGAEGAVTDQQIEDQIAELNWGYRQADQDFVLHSVERTNKRKWFRKCFIVNAQGNISRVYKKITKRLAVDPAHTLNIYSCRPAFGGDVFLGFATFPWFFPEDDKKHSAVVHWLSLPGGAFPYDEGDTAVHEVGHYVGLYHTFYPYEVLGDGCTPPGDYVNDTKYEMSPASGCPEGRNTCPQPGADPIHNFMDYSYDACINKFTAGQRNRFDEALDIYRPSLGE